VVNSPVLGWILAVAAVAAGYVGYGWPGVLLAVSVVVFWLLLQFSRALRLMRTAAQQPMGSVKSALMLQTRMHSGLRLADVMKMTGSFGVPLRPLRGTATSEGTESYVWTDSGGDALQITLQAGKVTAWKLQRSPASPARDEDTAASAGAGALETATASLTPTAASGSATMQCCCPTETASPSSPPGSPRPHA
jgi:hypothetical protein